LLIRTGDAFAAFILDVHAIGAGCRSSSWRHPAWLHAAGDAFRATRFAAGLASGITGPLLADLLFSDLLLSLPPVAFVITILFTFSLPYLLGAIPYEIFSAFLSHLILLNSGDVS
jgi:hypothetical protein